MVLGLFTAAMGNPVQRGAMIQSGFPSYQVDTHSHPMVKVVDYLVGRKTWLDHGPALDRVAHL